MLDVFDITNINNTTVFYTQGLNGWQTWQKPKNCKFVYITVIGGGGGGGGGRSSANNTSIGGGGGASSSITTGIFQANLLPDTLSILVGGGGAGEIGSGGGGSGAIDGGTGRVGGKGGDGIVIITSF